MLKGEKVFLRPTPPEEIPQFYAWATNPDPDIQRYYYGERIPAFEEFLADYEPHFFDGSQPYKGRCYTILFACSRPFPLWRQPSSPPTAKTSGPSEPTRRPDSGQWKLMETILTSSSMPILTLRRAYFSK